MSSQPLSFSCFSYSRSLILFCLTSLCSILSFFFSISLIPYFSHLPPLSHFYSCPLCHQSFSFVPSHTVFFHFLLFPMLHGEVLGNPSPSEEWPFDLCWLRLSCQQCSEVLVETSGVAKPNFSRWSPVPVQVSWGGWDDCAEVGCEAFPKLVPSPVLFKQLYWDIRAYILT